MLFSKTYLVSCRCLKGDVVSYCSEVFTVSSNSPFNLYVDEKVAREEIKKEFDFDSVFVLGISRVNKSQEIK